MRSRAMSRRARSKCALPRYRTGKVAAALLLLTTGSCSLPPLPLDLVVRDSRLVFWSERSWRWFLIPQRKTLEVDEVEVWQGEQWMWRVRARNGQTISLPLAYGTRPANAEQLVAPRPLRPGVIYRIDVGNNARVNAFRLDGKGGLWVGDLPYRPDPDLAARLRRDAEYEKARPAKEKARIRQLIAAGMTEPRARAAVADERRRGIRY